MNNLHVLINSFYAINGNVPIKVPDNGKQWNEFFTDTALLTNYTPHYMKNSTLPRNVLPSDNKDIITFLLSIYPHSTRIIHTQNRLL